MKTIKVLLSLMVLSLLLAGCTKEANTGTLQFKTLNPLTETQKSVDVLKALSENPPLVGDTTATYLKSLKLCIGDVWVSQEEVVAGEPDDLLWVRLTDETNYELKLFEDHQFSEVDIPAGTYQSIKITFRNIFYRYVELIADPTVSYELLETMGSWSDPCDENDESFVPANYFSTAGNHSLNDDGVFELVSEGEKIGGFTIEEGKLATVSWRLGAGVTEPCINYLIDENENREWDCGIDYTEDECPAEMEYMWDFLVEYDTGLKTD